MTLVPNLLVTGVLSMLVSVVIFTWGGRSARREGRSSVLILLSIGLLLVGGGFGPPLIGVFAGAAAMVISASRVGGHGNSPVASDGCWPRCGRGCSGSA